MPVDYLEDELSESSDYAVGAPSVSATTGSGAAAAPPAPMRAGSRSAQEPEPIKEVIPVGDDTDSLTQRTVQKMCEYIQAGVKDPAVQNWARFAIAKFPAPPGSSEQQGKCWSDFFLLRHAVRFVQDEPRLFSIGEGDALDLLIAPAVLVKMESPAEDCDGFTMLMCALLTIQGVKCYVVTLACDPSDQTRWSHVFPLAELPDGSRIALDASHGKFPGWMVPRKHIFRWQAWDLDGKPVDVQPPEKTSLHGYRRRGMGQEDNSVVPIQFFGGSPTTDTPAVSTPPYVPPSTPFNWGNLISSLTNAGVKAYQTSQLPPQYFTDPNTGKLIFAPANVPGGTGYGYPFGQGSTFGSMLPILGIGLAVAVAVAISRGK